MPTVKLDKSNVPTLPALNGKRTAYRDDPKTGIRGLVLIALALYVVAALAGRLRPNDDEPIPALEENAHGPA